MEIAGAGRAPPRGAYSIPTDNLQTHWRARRTGEFPWHWFDAGLASADISQSMDRPKRRGGFRFWHAVSHSRTMCTGHPRAEASAVKHQNEWSEA